jgi:serine/threonine protein kinase
LAAGTRLGPYEILGVLGAVGMGVVYRARHTRLGRDVAIRVLPEAFADDPDRLRRFEQEARAVAALNHPNIVTIHDVGMHPEDHHGRRGDLSTLRGRHDRGISDSTRSGTTVARSSASTTRRGGRSV